MSLFQCDRLIAIDRNLYLGRKKPLPNITPLNLNINKPELIESNKIKITNLPWGKLGLSICYDLRFSNHYRQLMKKKADFITVPSAFTKNTGERHWHVLIRSRAIENFCYIFAPAQGGTHYNGRKTFGHSLIINPWGEII